MNRRNFIEKSAMASGLLLTSPNLSFSQNSSEYDFPLTDLHVHTTPDFTMNKIMEIGNQTGVNFGIVEHPVSWALKDNRDLEDYINKLRKYPVYIALQPTYPG